MAITRSQQCANHPDRPALALCMSCRKMICQECATQWEGINYCVTCLRARRQRVAVRSNPLSWIAVLAMTLGLFWAAVEIIVVVGTLLAEVL